MRILKIVFWIIWRIWFCILTAILVLVMFPLLFVSILKEEWYPYFFKLARIWAKCILFGCGFFYKVEREEKLESGKSYMLVANHTSIIDIMLMLAVAKSPFVFVGKKELAKFPIFGFLYKRTCIMVDRSCAKSKRAVYDRAQKRLNQGLSICIFPEGGVPNDTSILLDNFKDGAFRLAIEHQIPIVPMTFPDNKKRFSYTLFSGSPGLLRAKVHHFVSTEGLTLEDRKTLSNDVREVIKNQLLEYQKLEKVKLIG